MTNPHQFSLKIKNYKCFGNKAKGFDQIKPLNLILGRNNSGKSTLLDFIEDLGKHNSATKYLQDSYRSIPEKNSAEMRRIHQEAQEMISIPDFFWHNKAAPEIIIGVTLEEEYLKRHFPEQTQINNSDLVKILLPENSKSRSHISNPRLSYWDIGKNYINSKATLLYKLTLRSHYAGGDQYKVESTRELIDVSLECKQFDVLKKLSLFLKENPHHSHFRLYEDEYKKIETALSKSALEQLKNSFDLFASKQFKRICPDRNILPEEDNINDLDISGDGRGVTNIIQNFYNQEVLDRNIIESNILSDLNQIFRGDAEFLSIMPRKKKDGKWEIALEEENKGLILLSQSGSSLKTVMILLVYLNLIPIVEKKKLSDYVFSVEELENNLHPSLLRRLLAYMSDKAKKDNCIFFMATHSSVAIDMFSSDVDAQIIHVTHDSKSSNVEVITGHLASIAILEDLGVRASDLLQANGVVWVEGPSDVVYIEKWLEMYCKENQKPSLDRGVQYEFQMFGGALLDSLCLIKNGSSSEGEEYKKLVSMLSFSRNAFVVIDSDAVKKRVKGHDKIVDKSKFSSAKRYIKSQFEELSRHGLNLGLWYKAGNVEIRTLEEYLDKNTIESFGTQDQSKKTKKLYAQMVAQSWNETKSLDDFPHGLKKEIENLYQSIMKWNQ
ncbi:MAG: AAA family ATPase [Nodosilinea sp.]